MSSEEMVDYFFRKMESGSIESDEQQTAFEKAIELAEENHKLKAENEQFRKYVDSSSKKYLLQVEEIEQLKSTISKMETITAQEDDLK